MTLLCICGTMFSYRYMLSPDRCKSLLIPSFSFCKGIDSSAFLRTDEDLYGVLQFYACSLSPWDTAHSYYLSYNPMFCSIQNLHHPSTATLGHLAYTYRTRICSFCPSIAWQLLWSVCLPGSRITTPAVARCAVCTTLEKAALCRLQHRTTLLPST